MMRNLIKAVLVTFMLTIPAWAGDMGQPRGSSGGKGTLASQFTITESATPGDIRCQLAASEITMTLLRSLLVLF